MMTDEDLATGVQKSKQFRQHAGAKRRLAVDLLVVVRNVLREYHWIPANQFDDRAKAVEKIIRQRWAAKGAATRKRNRKAARKRELTKAQGELF